MDVLPIYLALGAFAGLIAGLFGVGGGLIIVPVLSLLFETQGMSGAVFVHLAIGTSLTTIVVTSVSSTWAHHRHGAVQWGMVRGLSVGIVIGALLGAVIAYVLPTRILRIVFGVFELAVAAQIGLNLMASAHRRLPGQPMLTVAGIVIGALSSVVGIGGGTLTVPFLAWCNVSIRRAVATASACGFPISLAGAVGFIVTGWGVTALPEWSTGYLYWPAFAGIAATSLLFAPFGARLAHRLPVNVLRRIFAGFLTILGVRMLVG